MVKRGESDFVFKVESIRVGDTIMPENNKNKKNLSTVDFVQLFSYICRPEKF